MRRIINTAVIIVFCFLVNCVAASSYEDSWDYSLPIPLNDPLWEKVKMQWADHYTKKDVDGLIETLKVLQNKYPDKVEPYLWLGKVYYLKGKLNKNNRVENYKLSEDYAAKAIDLDTKNVNARKILFTSASAYKDFNTIIDKYLPESEKESYTFPVGRALPELAASDMWDEAIKYWDMREKIESAEKAVELFKKIADSQPDNVLAKIWVTRAIYYLGYYYTSIDQHEKGLPYYKEGIEYGKKALALDPNSVPAHYWRQVNLSRSIQTTNLLNKARNLKPIMNHLVFTANENPTYFYNGPVLSIATIILHGGWVAEKGMGMAGYNMEAVITGVNLGVIAYPSYLYSHFAKAQVLAHIGEKDQAIRILNNILTMDPYRNKYHAPENLCVKRLVKKFLAEMTR